MGWGTKGKSIGWIDFDSGVSSLKPSRIASTRADRRSGEASGFHGKNMDVRDTQLGLRLVSETRVGANVTIYYDQQSAAPPVFSL